VTEHVNDNTAEIIRDLAREAAAPEQLEPGYIYGWLNNGQP
jgi:hypothetical protein